MDISKLELIADSQNARTHYNSLPTYTEILARMALVASPHFAVEQIFAAREEAWKIRENLASTWPKHVLVSVKKMLLKEIGPMTPDEKKAHPLLGPLFITRYPDGIFEDFKKQASENSKKLNSDEKKQRSLLQNHDAQKNAAKVTNQLKEARRMKGCVDFFVTWSIDAGYSSTTELLSNFPKVQHLSLKRSQELIRTLLSAQTQSSIRNDLLNILQRQGFPNATQEVVDDCLHTIEKHKNM